MPHHQTPLIADVATDIILYPTTEELRKSPNDPFLLAKARRTVALYFDLLEAILAKHGHRITLDRIGHHPAIGWLIHYSARHLTTITMLHDIAAGGGTQFSDRPSSDYGIAFGIELRVALFACQNQKLCYHFAMVVRAAIYARTSSDCPLSNEAQIERLETVAAARGWTVVQVFTDRPMSAKRGLDRRPGEVACVEAIQSGAIDKILIWSIDRIGKSLVELAKYMETCHSSDVSMYLHEQNAVASQSLCDMAALLALHLRQSRREQILRGQAAARAASVRFGRPPISASKVEKAKQGLAAGKGVRQVARLAGISAASVSRIKSASAARISGTSTPLH